MRTRARRFFLVVLLLAAGVAAGLTAWNVTRQLAQLDGSQQDLGDRLDQLEATLDAVTTAQQAYVTPTDRPSARVSTLIDSVRSETAALGLHVRSIEGGRAFQAATTAVGVLDEVESRAEEHVRLGQDLMATDLVFAEGHPAVSAIASAYRSIRAAESAAYRTARMNALTYSWSVIGGVAGLWMLGLLLLARVPATPPPAESSSLLPTPTLVTGADAEPFSDLPIHAPPNLEAAARVCTAMAQMTSADDLNRLLHQAASVLEASGFVVWMAAGEELFAAAAVGYSPQIVRTLGPINRSAMNATAAACRSGTLQVVSADLAGRSAVAAPMLASDRCVGVLAVEVPAGREEDSTTRAIATMFAAQLTAALAGWPAASAAAPVHVPPLDRAAEA